MYSVASAFTFDMLPFYKEKIMQFYDYKTLGVPLVLVGTQSILYIRYNTQQLKFEIFQADKPRIEVSSKEGASLSVNFASPFQELSGNPSVS